MDSEEPGVMGREESFGSDDDVEMADDTTGDETAADCSRQATREFFADPTELLRESLLRRLPCTFDKAQRRVKFEGLNISVSADAPCRWCDRKRQPYSIGSLWLFFSCGESYSIRQATDFNFKFVSVLEKSTLRAYFNSKNTEDRQLDPSVPLALAQAISPSEQLELRLVFRSPGGGAADTASRRTAAVKAYMNKKRGGASPSGSGDATSGSLLSAGGAGGAVGVADEAQAISDLPSVLRDFGEEGTGVAAFDKVLDLEAGVKRSFGAADGGGTEEAEDAPESAVGVKVVLGGDEAAAKSVKLKTYQRLCGRRATGLGGRGDTLSLQYGGCGGAAASIWGVNFAASVIPLASSHLTILGEDVSRTAAGKGSKSAQRGQPPFRNGTSGSTMNPGVPRGADNSSGSRKFAEKEVPTPVKPRSLLEQLDAWKAQPIILVPSSNAKSVLNFKTAFDFLVSKRFSFPTGAGSGGLSAVSASNSGSHRFNWSIASADRTATAVAAAAAGASSYLAVNGTTSGGSGGIDAYMSGLHDLNDPAAMSRLRGAFASESHHRQGVKALDLKVYDSANIHRMSRIDWYASAAVFLHGADWQFKGWPFKSLGDLFTTVKAFYIAFEDDVLPQFVRTWPVEVLRLRRHSRHGDATVWLQLVESLEKFLAQPRDFKKFDKEAISRGAASSRLPPAEDPRNADAHRAANGSGGRGPYHQQANIHRHGHHHHRRRQWDHQ